MIMLSKKREGLETGSFDRASPGDARWLWGIGDMIALVGEAVASERAWAWGTLLVGQA